MRLKMNRAIAGYLLAGIAMLLCLLYLRFPAEAVTDYVKAALPPPGIPGPRSPSMRSGRPFRRDLRFRTFTVGFPGPPGCDPPCGRLNPPRGLALSQGAVGDPC